MIISVGNLFIILITTILISIICIKYIYKYWKRQKILQINPEFPFGNMKDLLLKRTTFGQTFRILYNYFKERKEIIGGYYFVLTPELIIVDTELIKRVLTKDFSYFTDRGTYLDEKNDPLSAHLFALPGLKWKSLRVKLTPTFTSGKMKMMFPILTTCSEEMSKILLQLSTSSEAIDIKDIFARYTIDVIGSTAFGINCDTLNNPNNDFRLYGNKILEVKGLDVLRQMLVISFPSIMKFLGIPGVNPEATNFFLNVVKETVNYRESNNINRNDFMQLLIDMKKEQDDSGLTIEQIAAQCFVFYLAGFETSSTTMTFCLFELSYNEDLQKKVREEIESVLRKHNNIMCYEAIMNMHFLDKCLSETLRKYPPLPFINREVTMDYKIEDKNIIIKKGTPIVISVEGLHWDEEFYPNPDIFNPERFSEEEKLKRPHYCYLPFGEGPRNCIGSRFGLLQAKIGLVQIIKNFECTVNKKTKIPLTMTSKTFVTAAEGGIWLNIKKI